jgi:small-conductance mechanosensitive channel
MEELLKAVLLGVGATAMLLGLLALLQRRLRLVRHLNLPIALGAIVAGLTIFARFQSGLDLARLDHALPWIWVFVAALVLLRLLTLWLFEVHLPSRSEVKLPVLLPTVFLWTAYILTALILLPAAFPDLDVTPILATSAVTSLVLGLALQPILGNFFSGIVISLERPFRINDWILVDGTEGRVVDITWRTTHLRTRDNDDLVIPNARIANEDVLNYNYPHRIHLERIYVGAHYRTPPYRVKQALLNVASRVEKVLENPAPEVYLHDFGGSAIEYELRAWIEDVSRKPAIQSYLRSEIWEEFRRQDIVIPFPIRTLEIEPRARTVEVAQANDEVDEGEITAILYVARGPDSGKAIRLERESIIVGRLAECDLQLSEPIASKRHLQIEWTDDGHRLTDLESSAGTRVNGRRTEDRVLRDLDRINIGPTILVYERHDG